MIQKTVHRSTSKRSTDLLRRPISLYAALALLLCSTLPLQAQFGGVWYIDNEANHSQASANRWYLVPAANPQQASAIDAYYSPNHAVTNGDPAKPFLTTYQTNKDNNSAWLIVPSGESGYYFVIHTLTGKYVIYEPPLPNDNDNQRKSMHLQTIDDGAYNPSTNDAFKFAITGTVGGNINIRPESRTGWYWNPAGNNANNYYGTNSPLFRNGLVGLWNQSDGNSMWHFESIASAICQAPSIHYDALDGTYTITWYGLTAAQLTAAGLDIRYTESGADPTASSPVYDGSTVVVAVNPTTVKAIVTYNDVVISAMATQVMYSASPDAPTFEVTCDSKLQLSCLIPTARLYYEYTTDGTDPADPDDNSTEWTDPVSLADGAKVKAIAYNGSNSSPVSAVYTFYTRPSTPTVVLSSTTAEVTFGGGATLHYTTDGSAPDPEDAGEGTSPYTITGLSIDADVDIQVVATSAGREPSCPVVQVKRPKRPTFTAVTNCAGNVRSHTLTFTGTEEGKTYWYALSNGSGQAAPALNTFTEYTPGSPVDIAAIPAWNGTDVTVTLHAYAKDAEGNTSVVRSQDYMLKYTDAPVVSDNDNTVTITGPAGATITYIVDGGAPQTYSDPFAVAIGSNHTVTATAQYGSEGESCPTVHVVFTPIIINDLAGLAAMNLDGAYVLGADIADASTYTTLSGVFTGMFDGAGHTISGLTEPLFGTVDGAVVRNLNLQGVNINSSADTVGAIACVAKGYTRIYNCGILPADATFPAGTHPVVSTTGKCAGGLVGSLRSDSRVVNCFSYADVSADNSAAGIVGRNTYGSNISVSGGKYTKLRTMVVNCLFYGNITAPNIWPVYGGTLITNKGATAINNYNYYSNGCTFSSALQGYNCSWPAQEEYLTRHEFHRLLLNSNRELCGWWVGAPNAPATMPVASVQAVPKDASLIYKWVLDPTVAPYPILKPAGYYASPVNVDADASWRVSANEWEGKKLGTLSVTVKPGAHHTTAADASLTLAITDMDTLHGDYAYRKVQLPYYNSVFGNPAGATWAAKYGDNYGEYVVTGWEITSTNGAEGTFTKHWEYGYNLTARDSSAKDLYATSGRVFAQGGYYYVPYDVTAITITAHWAKAYYLRNADNSYDRVNMSGSNTGTHFAPAGTRPALGNGQTPYTGTINDVASAIPSKGTVYDYAIVLAGNYQYRNGAGDITGTNDTWGFTLMSVDLDFDNEPDYCLEWQLGNKTNRQKICPIRFDFLPVVELGLALKENGSTQYYSLGCYSPLGHFEVTETSLIHFIQFEFGQKDRTEPGPLILNGGIFDQFTKGTMASDGGDDDINYILIGGNLKMPSFTPGAHVNKTNGIKSTRHCAVNVFGGEIDNIYLTGNYNESITPHADNPHCYIDGGRFKQVAAAGKEGIRGNVYFRINHAAVWEFYGGSTMASSGFTGTSKLVSGNIDVTIDNSIVTKYCGGPKFGDMNHAAGKTVTTRATGTTFGVFYGGGNGGTSYLQYASTDVSGNGSYGWTPLNNYTISSYHTVDTGYTADYDMEIVNVSTGTESNSAYFRTYFYAAQFSATNTGSISNTLDNCTVLTNFYGGGNLGGVNGSVNSTLTGCTIEGSAFGAGYSASIPEVTIYNKDKTPPTINMNTGIITPQSGGTGTTYTWTNETSLGGSTLSTGSPAVMDVDGVNYYYTEVSLENLGTVTGSTSLTLNNSTVGVNVYGGGDESKVTTNTVVTLDGGTSVAGSVFGAGRGSLEDTNMARVGGSCTVTLDGAATHVLHNIYGGGELSMVNGNTQVNIVAGKVGATDNPESTDGFVFGGGKGTLTDPLFANVKGNTHVTMSGGTVHNTLFGGGELASVGTFTLAETADAANDIVVGEPISCADGTGRCLVEISGGQIGHKDATLLHDIGYVFGAGMGVYTDPHAAEGLVYSASNARFGYVDSAEVQISDNAFIVGAVWGGSEDGQVLHNCGVKVSGGQIGCGYNWVDEVGLAPYTSTQWDNAIAAVKTQNDANINSLAAEMPECMHWPYGVNTIINGNPTKHYLPYDPYADLYGATDASVNAGDGHTFFGNVFGGGSGYYAYLTDDGAGDYTAEWYEFQGRVRGNTYVEITGGHILTSIYGGCEFADVMGSSSVVMTGGTLGVPRTLDSILDHPVTCYLFGAGKGDQRTRFSTSTNVHDVKVSVTGGVIFGSVFGGGEDGHVLGDAEVTIGGDAWVGTWGSSYVDGNIFGAGRGFGGERITAGTVGGNVTVNIEDTPTMLGSVYGGGRLASVGTYFVDHGEEHHGMLQPDIEDDPATPDVDESSTHGHITVNISGGTIGNNRPYRYQPISEGPLSDVLPTCPLTEFDVHNNHIFHTKGGNVFGGSMGRLTKLDGTLNEEWVEMALVKETQVNISGGIIRGNVYGGGEIGTVDQDTYVNITGGTIGTPVTNVEAPYAIEYHYGSIFGGGSGLLDHPNAAYVRGNTHVSMSAGQVLASVYGGGEMATVGVFEYTDDAVSEFHITDYTSGGATTVEISGGTVGPSEELHMPQFYGHVFGAGKGLAYDTTRYTQVPYLNFVYSTDVTISGTAFVKGSVYGGSENGHVYQNTDVKIQGGQIGCGAGRTTAYAESAFIDPRVTAVTDGNALAECPHWTYAAPYSTYDPYANSSGQYPDGTSARGGRPTGTDGHTFYGNVFGGGSGVFPYMGKTALDANTHSEYVRSAGQVRGNTSVTISGGHILTSVYGGCELTDVLGDSCVVVMTAGTLGVPRTKAQMLAHPVTCYLFGAGKGDQRTFFNEWTNVQNTRVTVGGTAIVYGSVFGGGEDGHIIGNSKVVVTGTPLIGTLGTSYVDGNIFGAGRGFGGDALTAGSVGGDIQVLIDGGHMMGSVYGGGRLASVGSYFVPVNNSNYGLLQPDVDDDPATDATDESESHGHITVSITGSAKVGNDAVSAEDKEHSGKVFGGCMGRLTLLDGTTENPIWPRLAKPKSTDVTIGGNAEVQNNVYGGGEMGYVLEDTKVTVQGTATVRGNVYGGGYGSDNTTYTIHDSSSLYANPSVHAGRVYGNTGVYILGGTVEQSVYGGAEMAPIGHTDLPTKGNTLVMIGNADGGNATIGGDIFGANNLAGTPKGNTAVHIYSTAHSGTNVFPTGIDALAAPYDELTTEDITINAATQTYALSAVYGGGNLAAHDPTAADGTTLVHVHYCDQNTIRNIYGGGNAADTKNNHVIIDGGCIENVFGGGNGYSATNNHDNPAAPNYNPGANVNGTARTEIHGGIIDNIFGGSNTRGEVRGTSSVNFDPDDVSPCPLINSDVFGGGNHAESNGNIEVTIPCGVKLTNVYGCGNEANFTGNVTLNVEGGVIDTVFGGAKNATIDGNITVNYTGGYVKELFGGNNKGGNITGTITVNVDVDPDYSCPDGLALTTVYGGGKDAAYTPHDCFRFSPTVNIMNNRYKPVAGDSAFVEIENVYGGGFGATAKTVSYPRVTVGGFADRSASITRGVRVYNTVYGGGYGAPVYGNTTTLVRGSTIIGRDDASTGMVFGGGYGTTAIIHGGTYVGVFGLSEIKSNVYGGGNAGAVLGNTNVQIGYIEQVLPVEILAVMEEGVVYATLVCSTPGVSIRYTLDGTTPTTETGTEYSTRFPFSWEHTIKAIAYKEGMIPSVVSFDEAPTPTIEIDGTTVTLDAYVGARIYYTKDGTDPTISSSLYGTVGESDGIPFTITSGEVVKAMAVMRGCVNSKVGYLTAEPPTVTLVGDDCTITSPAGTRIIYTTDGSNPSSTMGGGTAHGIPAGTNSVTINNVSNGTTIKAIVEQDGYMPSNISAARYTAAP